jgi:hypothetical protein
MRSPFNCLALLQTINLAPAQRPAIAYPHASHCPPEALLAQTQHGTKTSARKLVGTGWPHADAPGTRPGRTAGEAVPADDEWLWRAEELTHCQEKVAEYDATAPRRRAARRADSDPAAAAV